MGTQDPFFLSHQSLRLQQTVNEAWRAQLLRCWSPKTSLLYTCPPDKVRPAREFDDGPGFYRWQKEVKGKDTYGAGMEDCALIGGVALSGLCDRWAVLHDAETAEMAGRLACGLMNLAVGHGFKGFIARGLCEEDSHSICSLSSRDQFTHWLDGLWRYCASGMATAAFLSEFARALVATSRFLRSRCTPERNWNFGMADGSPDPLGICTMWGPDLHPHEQARLPMFYLATWAMTEDMRWSDCYEEYADEAIVQSLRMADPSAVSGIPCYSLLQANVSLGLLLALETEPARHAHLREAMDAVAQEARRRIDLETQDPSKRFYGMCDDGELALTALTAPSCDVRDLVPFLDLAITREEIADPCRAAHLLAAWWRCRVRAGG